MIEGDWEPLGAVFIPKDQIAAYIEYVSAHRDELEAAEREAEHRFYGEMQDELHQEHLDGRCNGQCPWDAAKEPQPEDDDLPF